MLMVNRAPPSSNALSQNVPKLLLLISSVQTLVALLSVGAVVLPRLKGNNCSVTMAMSGKYCRSMSESTNGDCCTASILALQLSANSEIATDGLHSYSQLRLFILLKIVSDDGADSAFP